MSAIDPRLKFLQPETKKTLRELESTGRFGVEVVTGAPTRAKVLIQFQGSREELETAGMEVTTMAGDIATGLVQLPDLDKLADHEHTVKIESSRPLARELDDSIPEINANAVHAGPPGLKGAGALVGIIDSGIDITHGGFRRPDGTSRIVALWDQGLTPAAGESSPTGLGYGVEYEKSDIDTALAAADPTTVVRHRDRDTGTGHGTHVAGIAAGDGSPAGNGQPAFTFLGVAPEADLIVVSNAVETDAFGDSANTLDAMQYIFDKAATLGKPVAINLSQGDNLGPHDGTSLLERGIDNLLGGPGRVMIKSAGNAGSDDIHAGGTVAAGGTESVRFRIPSGDSVADTMDVWYAGTDRFTVNLRTPGGDVSADVAPGTTTTLSLPNGNQVFVDSVLGDPNNGDNRVYLQFMRGTAPVIEAGTWSLRLRGDTVVSGRFDAWIERGQVIPAFLPPHLDNGRSISIPGTSQEIIAVGSYVTKGAGVGSLSSFSSRGPTRDGRPKPEISAPGQFVMSARAAGISSGSGAYNTLAGTSMAAPHIAGVAALMLQKDRTLTQAQVRECLVDTARSDANTGAVPNNDWGAGKVDAQAAVNHVAGPTLKFSDDPTLKFSDDPTLKFSDDPTLKFSDDPTLKFSDDPTFKFSDDLTLKFSDDPTLKFSDDPSLKFADDPTLKFSDDPSNKFADDPTIKFTDDPVTIKFSDDGGTGPADPIKQPGLDGLPDPGGVAGQPPASPRGGGAAGSGAPEASGGAAPFVLATPHHSNAWAQSYPQAHQATLAQHQAALQELEQLLGEAAEAAAQGRLSPQDEARYRQLQEQHRQLCQELEQLGGGEGGGR